MAGRWMVDMSYLAFFLWPNITVTASMQDDAHIEQRLMCVLWCKLSIERMSGYLRMDSNKRASAQKRPATMGKETIIETDEEHRRSRASCNWQREWVGRCC